MHRILLVLFLLAFAWSCQLEQRRVEGYQVILPEDYQWPEKTDIKILTWNVEHFVDLYNDPYINTSREDNPDSLFVKQKIALLLKAIKKADADVVVLQEFESAKFLEDIVNDSLPEMGYEFFTDAPSRSWYMNVVGMSRFPLGVIRGYHEVYTPVIGHLTEEGETETQSHINTRMWSAEVYTDSLHKFLLTGLHLKAGGGDRNVGMRMGQIKFLKRQFNDYANLNPEPRLVVVGDLNAYPDSEELELLKSSPVPELTLVDPLEENINTHPSDSPYRRLDYLLPNTIMNSRLVEGSVKVEFLLDSLEMRLISDHLPVSGRFRR